MGAKPAAVLVLALLCVAGCASEETPEADVELSPITFYREYVTVEPSREITRVNALYYFRNESDLAVEQGIRYPFPVDRFHLYPRTVRVWEVAAGELRPMGFSHRERSVMWNMRFEPREEKLIRVEYVQQIAKAHAIYIVTTTQEWHRPIEHAEFEFRIPREFKDVRFSFTPDVRVASGDTIVCYMSKTNFMPEEDLVVTWGDGS